MSVQEKHYFTGTQRSRGRSPFRRILQLADIVASLDRFRTGAADEAKIKHLERISVAFIRGYNLMFEAEPLANLVRTLSDAERDFHGFIVEGSAMGAAIRDGLSVSGTWLAELKSQHGSQFEYLIQVGSGWAVARMPWRARKIHKTLTPLLHSLTLDGRGFHDIFFHPQKLSKEHTAHETGHAARAYDQGVGRAIWFVSLGHVENAIAHANRFPTDRRRQLLSGLGLAASYAGPAAPRDWNQLLSAFPECGAAIKQGVIFAASAQAQAGYFSENLSIATQHLLKEAPAVAAARAHRTRPPNVTTDRATALTQYEGWRCKIQRTLISEEKSTVELVQ